MRGNLPFVRTFCEETWREWRRSRRWCVCSIYKHLRAVLCGAAECQKSHRSGWIMALILFVWPWADPQANRPKMNIHTRKRHWCDRRKTHQPATWFAEFAYYYYDIIIGLWTRSDLADRRAASHNDERFIYIALPLGREHLSDDANNVLGNVRRTHFNRLCVAIFNKHRAQYVVGGHRFGGAGVAVWHLPCAGDICGHFVDHKMSVGRAKGKWLIGRDVV